MTFLVLPQHEQFYPGGLSVFAPFPLGWIKLAPKFKDLPAPTAIFKALNFYFKIQRLSMCMRTLSYTISLPDCSLLLLPVSQTKVVEGLPIYFQAFVLCTMHLEDTGTTATFLGLGCHFHSVLEQTILMSIIHV